MTGEQPPSEYKTIIEPSSEASKQQPKKIQIQIGKTGLPINRRWLEMEEKRKQEEEIQKERGGLGIKNEESPDK